MRKNIFNKFLYGVLGLGVLASCSNDLPYEDGKILENESTTYIRLSLVGENLGTRAEGEYENGTGDESAVKSVLLTFFDAGRNYVGRTTVNVNENAEEVVVPGEPNTVERFLTVVAPVTLPENINYPRYVVAYVNPTSASGDLLVDKLEDAMKYIRTRDQISPSGFRTMNNSVYYNEGTGYVRFATEVDFTTQFFPTLEEAKEATGDKTINITVERMEAKVRLSTDISDLEPEALEQKDANNSELSYELKFVPEAWFVNGTEKRSFLIKNYRNERKNYLTGHATFPDNDFGMSFAALQNAFKNNNSQGSRWNEINREDYLRSFWAIDPTYFIEGDYDHLYPEVSYDVRYTENGTTINPGDNNVETYNFPLLYRSYENVIKEWNEGKNTRFVRFFPGGGAKSHEYVPENTMSFNTLTSTDALASMTSVVLVGHYMIKRTDTGETVFDGKTTDTNKSFYFRHDAGNNLTVMLSDQEAIDFFLERGGSTLFVQTIDQDGNPVENTFEPLRAGHLKDARYGISYNDFELVYPAKTITGGTVLSEQWRTLRIKKNGGVYNPKIFVYDAALDMGEGGYKNLTDANIAELYPRFYSTYGVIERFNTGKAYFNIPLKHIWGANKGAGQFDAKSVVLGDYGVVRNHIYDLTINKITGLGTGIGDPKQPIVPPTENDQYYISTRLNILQWRLVKQSVDL